MNKILVFLALIGAFSFLPLESASAAHVRVVGHRHGRHLIVHRGPFLRAGCVVAPAYRCAPVYRRPVYRVCGPRYYPRYRYPRPCGFGIAVRI